MALESKSLYTENTLGDLKWQQLKLFRFVKGTGSQDMQDMLRKDLRYRISQEKNIQDDELKK
jgi:hypothetical protein